MSLFQICWSGLVPIGTLLVGVLAEAMGVRETMFACAVVCLAASVGGRHGWPGLRGVPPSLVSSGSSEHEPVAFEAR
jgi:hypothetical protein